jgi:D-glycero-alpha-D-manno-heptose-7-phosphate kinase
VRYHLIIPARINLLGNPSDANEGDFATISAAVNVYAGALVEPAEGLVLEIAPHAGLGSPQQSLQSAISSAETLSIDDLESSQRLEYPHPTLPLPYTGQLDLLKGAVNRLYKFSPEFRQKFERDIAHQRGIRIATWSEVPRQSGLGGSSLFVILVLASLRQFYQLDQHIHNDYILAELTQRVDAKELGIACGFADRYVPIFGGIGYLDYRGKLYHHEIYQEPYVTYERLDQWVNHLPIVAITTGIQHDSGDVHGRMRPKYIEEYDAWAGYGGAVPRMLRLMQGAWETAWRGKIALLHDDLESFGELMNRNHRLVDEMMTYCGFTDGAGWANNLFIQTALHNGAMGAKLTGAGGGGSVFALTHPGQEQALVKVWQQAAEQHGLTKAHVFQPQICHSGLVIQ